MYEIINDKLVDSATLDCSHGCGCNNRFETSREL